ncbi:MAG: hypothetical protein HOY71_44585 [Nonomuraea sp.]|nr:hypothetical protein [Nonomuraea sp.]
MIGLLRMLTRGQSAGERTRGRLMSAGAALATFLLCSGVVLVAYSESQPRPAEAQLIAALTMALLTVPAVGFSYQVSRLATATRERRLAALRLAGATPREVRLVGAYESGWRALLGTLLGGALFLIANLLAPGLPLLSPLPAVTIGLAVTLGGLLSGFFAGRHVISSPLGVVRRAHHRGPRVSDLLILLVAAGLLAYVFRPHRFGSIYVISLATAFGGVLLVIGLALAATWVIAWSARLAWRRAASGEALLAARMVQDDPRSWARALAVAGVTVFFASGVASNLAYIMRDGKVEPSRLLPFGLISLALLFALVTSIAALVVHQAEESLDHRRSFAVLVASGIPVSSIRRVLSRQALIAAVPVCTVSAVPGVIIIHAVAPELSVVAVAWSVLAAVVLVGVATAAAVLAARLTPLRLDPTARVG